MPRSYHFQIGDPDGIAVYFAVTAGSAGEAVQKANEDLSEEGEGDEPFLGRHLHHTYLSLGTSLRVTEKDIIEVSEAEHLLDPETIELLQRRGYEPEIGSVEELVDIDEPAFVRHLEFTDSDERMTVPDGAIKVTARYDYGEEAMCFDFNAFMHGVEVTSIPNDTANVALHAHPHNTSLSSKALGVTADELPAALDAYEEVFMEALGKLYQREITFSD